MSDVKQGLCDLAAKDEAVVKAWVAEYVLGWPPAEQTDLMSKIGLAIARKNTRPPSEPNPPSEKQMEFLRKLGYSGAPPASKFEASKLIDTLKTAQGFPPSAPPPGSGGGNPGGGTDYFSYKAATGG